MKVTELEQKNQPEKRADDLITFKNRNMKNDELEKTPCDDTNPSIEEYCESENFPDMDDDVYENLWTWMSDSDEYLTEEERLNIQKKIKETEELTGVNFREEYAYQFGYGYSEEKKLKE